MVEIPQQPMEDFFSKLGRWQKLAADLDALRATEMILRKELFGIAFDDPSEGTNYYPLGNGWRLKAVHKLERRLDETNIPLMRAELATRYQVSIDPLLKWKPTLAVAAYKALPDDVRVFFDNIVTMTPGAPSLAIVPPSDKDPEEAPAATTGVDKETGEITIAAQPTGKKKRTTKPRAKKVSE